MNKLKFSPNQNLTSIGVNSMTTPSSVQVTRITNNFFGVFAVRLFIPGEFIENFAGYPSPIRTRYSVFLEGMHIEPTGALKYLNHACNPNAHFKGRDLIALRPIAPGEEITIDYKATETELAAPFQCNCGAPNCAGWIE
jgi:hypothetical protein